MLAATGCGARRMARDANLVGIAPGFTLRRYTVLVVDEMADLVKFVVHLKAGGKPVQESDPRATTRR